MKAEIISVGTELLLGHTINSDASYVARELAACGIDLARIQTVGDNAGRLAEALKTAASESDLIITTGGLGPTRDDLTKETAAEFAGLPLVEDPDTLAELKRYFGSRPISKNQFKQALIPLGAVIFPNENGTAPGMAIPFGKNQHIILLPGPPSELLPMLEKHVRPFLAGLEHKKIVSVLVRTFGIGEGDAAVKIGNLVENGNPTVAPYASGGEMFFKITAKAAAEAEARAMIEPVANEITKKLGAVVYGLDAPSLADVTVNALIQIRKSVATAESCTGGLLAKLITDVPGASAIFSLGVVTYSNAEKEKILSVPGEELTKHGAVSPEVARAMATGIRRLAGSDFGIGITGIAGPDGATSEKPLGLVYIGFAADEETRIFKMLPPGRYPGREKIRARAAAYALDLLRRELANLPPLSNNPEFALIE